MKTEMTPYIPNLCFHDVSMEEIVLTFIFSLGGFALVLIEVLM
jgi:hypothetical protein